MRRTKSLALAAVNETVNGLHRAGVMDRITLNAFNPPSSPPESMPTDLFDRALATIPSELRQQSGKVFYSGRLAFQNRHFVYVLGENPGGDPALMSDETIDSHSRWVAESAPENWSAYRDETWKFKAPGTHGMQPRMLHMFRGIDCDPGLIPSSNLVFSRSRQEQDLGKAFHRLADKCWPFHQLVLDTLTPKVILCLGRRTGNYVQSRTGAHELLSTFTEQNLRRWESHAFRSSTNLKVVVLTHPSRVDWTQSATDPTSVLLEALRMT